MRQKSPVISDHAKPCRDRGVPLTELIVYVGLFALIAIIAGSVFFSYFSGERSVQAITQATNSGQVITNSLTESMRASSAISVAALDEHGQFAVAKVGQVTDSDPIWQCQAWFFSASGDVFTKTSAEQILEPNGDFTSWSHLASGVEQLTAGKPFLDPTTISAGSSSEIAINFHIVTEEDHEPVQFSTSVSNRAQNPGDALLCF